MTGASKKSVVYPAEKQRAYISGGMTGLPNCNYTAFFEAEDFLKAKGFEPINPARNFDGDQSRELREYYSEDFKNLCTAGAIAFLPGWRQSQGARIEYMIARALELDMYQIIPNDQFVSPDNLHGNAKLQFMDADLDGPVELVAGALVRNGARQAIYGPPDQDFKRTATMRTGLWGAEVATEQVALDMVLLKLSRLVGTPGHHDSIVDAIGYLICYALIMAKLKK